MITKAKKWFVRAMALVGGGLLGAAAILLAYQEEGLTCTDVAEIVKEMQDADDPNLIPFQQKVVPLTGCETEIIPNCSRLPDGTFCRYGMRYGPGHGGVILPPDPRTGAPTIDACNVADGVVTPCVTDGTYDPATYDVDKIDPADVIRKITERFPDKKESLEKEVEE